MATLILKATEKCNSNCYYCDVVRKEHTGTSMPLEVLEKVFERLDEYLLSRPEEQVEILWHGGEPLLLGPQYFRTALDFQDRHCGRTKSRIRHAMQTNLTCFTEEFVEVFRGMGITAVGTSYDPEPHMRGPGKDIDSDMYNRRFMKALSVLERNGFGWGMIYVVTKRSLARPLDVFYYLTNLKLTGGFNMNPVLIYDEGRKDVAITPGEYVEFLGALFPVWWKYRHRYPDMEPFRSLVRNIMDGHRSLGCVEAGDCAYHHVNVAPDGGTSQCGRSADWGLLDYGSLMKRTLADILQDHQRGQLAERILLLRDGECGSCRFWEICHGGCPLDAYSRHKSFMHKSEWCDARRGFISNYFEPITGVRFEPHDR